MSTSRSCRSYSVPGTTWSTSCARHRAYPTRSVLTMADGRILITFDRDFGGLVYGFGISPAPRGVVYLRTGLALPDVVAARVLTLVENPSVQLDGWFPVVTMNAIRQRPMP